MSYKSIFALAEGYGLALEAVLIPHPERAFRVYKGANQLFFGTEEAIRNFFIDYEKSRPDPYQGSMVNYRE